MRRPITVNPFTESATPPALAVMELFTPAWGQLLWDLTDPRSLRWVASAQMAAQGWAVRPPGWVLFSMIQITKDRLNQFTTTLILDTL